jgi:hypothetical protein
MQQSVYELPKVAKDESIGLRAQKLLLLEYGLPTITCLPTYLKPNLPTCRQLKYFFAHNNFFGRNIPVGAQRVEMLQVSTTATVAVERYSVSYTFPKVPTYLPTLPAILLLEFGVTYLPPPRAA